MQITRELFVIPHGENFILYAPLKKAVAEVNLDMIALLQRLKRGEKIEGLEGKLAQLKEIGIVTEGETPVAKYVPKKGLHPTALTLVPTLDCNLRCIYCYAEAGVGSKKIMDTEVAKRAIDLVIENAVSQGRKQVALDFHGGGEPLLRKNMGLVTTAVNYFRDQTALHHLNPTVTTITNGAMGKKTLEWAVSNFDSMTVSFDGPEDIQNRQRPFNNGRGSFSRVLETIKYLEAKRFNYYLRSTITNQSVSRMPEIVRFIRSVSSVDNLALEPLFECGRCVTTKVDAPDEKEYVKSLIEAREVGRQLGMTVHYSGSVMEGVYDSFCGAIDAGLFCVLPEGDVTACLEVCRKSDPRAEVFMIGQYDFGTKKFVIHEDRLDKLRSRNVDSIPHCTDCFAKYNCSGDCPAKVYATSGSLFDTSSNPRCEMTRNIIKEALLEKMKGEQAK